MADKPPQRRAPAARSSTSLVPVEAIQQRILVMRGHRVMLDADLAVLYEVPTGNLVRAVKRNIDRFPDDFMFQLDVDEFEALRSQSGIASGDMPAQSENLIFHSGISSGWGGRRTPPFAFTEHGVAMLSSVLRSKRAVTVNIEIVRAFVLLRQLLATHVDLARKLDALEGRVGTHDAQITQIIEAIRQLMEPPPPKPKRQIGFAPPDDGSGRAKGRQRRRPRP